MGKRWFAGIGFFIVTFLLVAVWSPDVLAFDPVEDFGDVDFNGETVTYVGYYNPFKENDIFNEGGMFPGRLEEAKEKFNIGEIEFLEMPWGAELVEGQMARLMSGDSKYDFWMATVGDMWSMAAEGAFYPVSDILPDEYYESMPQDIQTMFENIEIGGTSYAFGLQNDHFDNIEYVVWNRDLFAREGLTPLDELYKAGEWDWEAFEEIALKAQKDTDDDGEIEQLGISNLNDWIHIKANDGDIVEVNEKGNYEFVLPDDDSALYALEKTYEWTSELEFGGDEWDLPEFRNGNSAMAIIQSWMFDNLEDMEDDWGLVPFPRGPDADEYKYPVVAFDSTYLPANVEDPEAMVALHTFLWHPDEYKEIRESEISQQAPDKVSYEVMQEASEKGAESTFLLVDIVGWWDYDQSLRETLDLIIAEGETPSTALKEIRPEVQAQIDDKLNQ